MISSDECNSIKRIIIFQLLDYRPMLIAILAFIGYQILKEFMQMMQMVSELQILYQLILHFLLVIKLLVLRQN